MIVYSEKASTFISQCHKPQSGTDIGDIIAEKMRLHGINYFDNSQVRAWRNSLPRMASVLENSGINPDIDVAVEYKIQQTRDRIDFLVCGNDSQGSSSVVVVELKQWSDVSPTNKENFVHAFGGHGEGDYWHPSYQAFNYSQIIYHFNEYVRQNGVSLPSCSYLHNMSVGYSGILDNREKFPLVEKSPVFYKSDEEKLAKFIKKHICSPNGNLIYEIENSRIIPSGYLAEMLDKALKGNDFFSYDEAQATAVAEITSTVEEAIEYNQKKTIIIRGGAGTGKSVIALNVLGKLINGKKGKDRRNAVYSTANACPRYLYKEKLTGKDFRKNAINNLLKYPTVFVNEATNFYDCALVDEAHRLFDYKSGVGLKGGVHVLDDVIRSSRVSVFFIDDDQAVTSIDFATTENIREAARRNRSQVIEGPYLELKTQFRVSGGDDYISFIKSFLGYNSDVSSYTPRGYEFEVFDSAAEMRERIRKKDAYFRGKTGMSGNCRMVAGYTYEWVSKGEFRDGNDYDIVLDDGEFKAKWNLRCSEKGQEYSWINDSESVDEVGCIHTCQGIDMNYCGVIIGKDFVYRDGRIQFVPDANARTDKASGIRRSSPEIAQKLIRNTYYVLLTRGILGTYVYCEDPALRDHLRSMINSGTPVQEEMILLPIVGEIAAGHEHFADDEILGSIEVDSRSLHPYSPDDFFFLRVSGDSMIGAGINDGDSVLIRKIMTLRDLHNGDIVACQIHGDRATLKTYYREESGVRLRPQNPSYNDIFISNDDFLISEARIIGKCVKTHKKKRDIIPTVLGTESSI